MGSPEGRIGVKVVGIVAKAAEEGGIRDAVRVGEHAAEDAGTRAGTRAAERAGAREGVETALTDAEHEAVPLTKAESDRIAAIPRGDRPEPSSYLPRDYIESHLHQFDDGATRFMTDSNLSKYGIAQRDGTSFVMPRNQVDDLIEKTGGDPRAMERELGLPDGFFDSNKVVRVDIDHPGDFGLRMPSGNEAGANDQWIPGGLLPNGVSEAVIDGRAVPDGGFDVSNFP